jgi:hypothetical protein
LMSKRLLWFLGTFYMVFCASSILHFDGSTRFFGFREVLPRRKAQTAAAGFGNFIKHLI